MTPEQHNFDDLRRLLSLKRHEQPPPGYFHHFSQRVILRIKDGETGERPGWLERWFADSPVLSRLFSPFQARPALGGLVGVGVCGLMVAGILYAEPEGSPMMVTGTGTGIRLAPPPSQDLSAMPVVFVPATNGILRQHFMPQEPAVPAVNSLGGAF